MKKTLFAFMALATAFGATSCQSDEELTQPTGKPMVINAVAEGIGTKTRAEMAYKYDILWSASDQIYVKNSANNATFTLQDGKGTTEGTFACASSPFESGDEVEAYYPASLVDGESLLWPASQTASTVIPMYSKQTLGSAKEENFSFASLGAMLQIVFTTSQADVTLKSITLKDDDATMSGTFNVDENGMAGITATDKAGITLDLGTGVPVGLAAKYFNIAVPAGKYSNLTITFTGTDESTCTLKGNVTLDHNTVGRLTLTGKEFKIPFGTGKAKATIGGSEVDVKWIQLWENGPKFAEKNVGASSPEDDGDYYAWGETETKENYSWSNYKWCNGTEKTLTKYCTYSSYGTVDNKMELDLADDAAYVNWGSEWRMPTAAEMTELLNCTWTWTTQGEKNGFKVMGSNGNSIFLPAAGYRVDSSLYDAGTDGYSMSSSLYDKLNLKYPNWAWNVNFFNSGKHSMSNGSRCYGYSVRPVLNESAE